MTSPTSPPPSSPSPSPPLVQTREIGELRIHALDAGLQRLDGGAMFGVVPKPLWERRIPADPRNRIPLGLRCLLVEAPETLILIDTGIGNKEDSRFQEIYGVENEGDPTRLEDAIREAGFAPSDIEIVLLTHLHFDHVGGATRLDARGSVVPSFPAARHVVQEGELAFAASPNERVRASYKARNLEALTEAELWSPVRGEAEITRGVRVIPTPGHTPHHQSVLLGSGPEKAFYLADLCPTVAHLPLPWIMGYDLEPLVTLETKRAMWERALHEDWLLIFEHDAETPWGKLDPEGKALRP